MELRVTQRAERPAFRGVHSIKTNMATAIMILQEVHGIKSNIKAGMPAEQVTQGSRRISKLLKKLPEAVHKVVDDEKFTYFVANLQKMAGQGIGSKKFGVYSSMTLPKFSTRSPYEIDQLLLMIRQAIHMRARKDADFVSSGIISAYTVLEKFLKGQTF